MSGTNPFDDSLTSDRVDWAQREEDRQQEETSVWSEEDIPLLPGHRADDGSQRPIDTQDGSNGPATRPGMTRDGATQGRDGFRGSGWNMMDGNSNYNDRDRWEAAYNAGMNQRQAYPDAYYQQQYNDGYRMNENIWGRNEEYRRRPWEPETGEYNRVRFPPTAFQDPFGTSRTLRAPTPTFDGSTPWRDYLVQFELIAELNCWDERSKALQLAASLRGPAQAVLADLEAGRRRVYHLVIEALEQRFGNKNQTELFKAMLRSRTRKSEESLPELAHDIKRLLNRAYPDATPEMKETLAKDYFIDALGDSDAKWRVYQARPRQLEDAVTIAVELEAFGQAESKKSAPPRKLVARTVEKRQDPSPTSDSMEELTKVLTAALSKGFEDLTKRFTNLQKDADEHPTKTRRKPSDLNCWNCGEKGHFRRNCPNPKNNAAPKEETSHQGNQN